MISSNLFILFTTLREINADLNAGVFCQLDGQLSVDG